MYLGYGEKFIADKKESYENSGSGHVAVMKTGAMPYALLQSAFIDQKV